MSRYSTRIRPTYRRPTRAQSTRVLSSISFVLFAFIAIVCLCPAVVKAESENTPHPEYGTVIGIGKSCIDQPSYRSHDADAPEQI